MNNLELDFFHLNKNKQLAIFIQFLKFLRKKNLKPIDRGPVEINSPPVAGFWSMFFS